MIEKEELEGVFMALCDQRNDEQCLEVLRRWKAQILQENPMAGLTDAELIYLNKLSEHVSNPVFSKFIVQLSRREMKGEKHERKR
jgi:DNA-binding FadR family transcriptional regulator